MDKKSMDRLWENYLASIGETVATNSKEYKAWHFGVCEESCAKDLALVLEGTKTATSATKIQLEYIDEPIPKAGDFHVITNWQGEAQCVIQTTEVNCIPYGEVLAEFAIKEAEGDGSLEEWRKVNSKLFLDDLELIDKDLTDDTVIICEEFRLVYR